jgi:hypothetical protein
MDPQCLTLPHCVLAAQYGRKAFGLMDVVVPPLMCIPMLAELALRLIYEPGHEGTHFWDGPPVDKEAMSTPRLQWLRRTLCWPCQVLCPCGTAWVSDTFCVVSELAFWRAPLVALDVTAISCFLLDRWVLLSIFHRARLARRWVHRTSNCLQLLRCLRPWAVGVKVT